MADDNLEFLKGTLDVLVLKALSFGPRHGYSVARWVDDATNGALQIEEGALYFDGLTMRRVGEDGLESFVVIGEEDGAARTVSFRFKRAKP